LGCDGLQCRFDLLNKGAQSFLSRLIRLLVIWLLRRTFFISCSTVQSRWGASYLTQRVT
jgi:hypothetical protein